jgi:hypothetical protein
MGNSLWEGSRLAGAQNKRLSSILTPLFKLGAPSTLAAILVVCTYADVRRGAHMSLVAYAFAWALLLWVAYLFLRLKKVVAHSNHLVVSNYIRETRVPYDHIQEIRARRARWFVLVRLRLRTACRFGRTVHFVLPSTLSRVESQPEVQLLREKCPHLCERSGGWWLAMVYLLRPRPVQQEGSAHESGPGEENLTPTTDT